MNKILNHLVEQQERIKSEIDNLDTTMYKSTAYWMLIAKLDLITTLISDVKEMIHETKDVH